MSTSDLNVVFVSDSLEFLLLLSKVGQVNVYTSAKSSTKVGWAGSQVTEVHGLSEVGNILNGSTSSAQTFENGTNV